MHTWALYSEDLILFSFFISNLQDCLQNPYHLERDIFFIYIFIFFINIYLFFYFTALETHARIGDSVIFLFQLNIHTIQFAVNSNILIASTFSKGIKCIKCCTPYPFSWACRCKNVKVSRRLGNPGCYQVPRLFL